MNIAYSQIADEQLDALEASNAQAYAAVLDCCELIFRSPGLAQSMSTAFTTRDGVLMRLAVPGHPPLKIFWRTNGPRIEAVFPHP